MRNKWHRNKILRLHASSTIAAIHCMASSRGVLGSLILVINPLLREDDSPDVLEFDFAQGASLAGDISETDFDKILLVGEFVRDYNHRDGTVAENHFREKNGQFVEKAASGDFVIVSQLGTEVIQLRKDDRNPG